MKTERKQLNKKCNCFMCITEKIWKKLNEVENLDDTFGEIRGMFIAFGLQACLGAIMGESENEMLEKIRDFDFAMSVFKDELGIEMMEKMELEMYNFEEMVSFEEKILADKFVNENMQELTLEEINYV